MVGKSSWKKRTLRVDSAGFQAGSRSRRRQASMPYRVPAGLSASATMTAGESLLTVNAASRSDMATNASVAANSAAARLANQPADVARPEPTITTATAKASEVGSGGM